MRVVITHLSGAYRGERQVHDTAHLTIGRAHESVVRLGRDDTLASGRHAEIAEERGVWTLRDVGSTNGTWVDGRRVERTRLRGGEVIAFGYGGPQLLFELVEEMTAERPRLDEPHEFPFRARYAWAAVAVALLFAIGATFGFYTNRDLVGILAALGSALLLLLGLAVVRVNVTVGPDGIERQGLWSTKRLEWGEIEALEARRGAVCTVRGAGRTIEFSPSDYREGHLLARLIAETSGKEWG